MFLIITYKSPAIYKLATDTLTGQVLTFITRSKARKYAEQNLLGVYKVFEF